MVMLDEPADAAVDDDDTADIAVHDDMTALLPLDDTDIACDDAEEHDMSPPSLPLPPTSEKADPCPTPPATLTLTLLLTVPLLLLPLIRVAADRGTTDDDADAEGVALALTSTPAADAMGLISSRLTWGGEHFLMKGCSAAITAVARSLGLLFAKRGGED